MKHNEKLLILCLFLLALAVRLIAIKQNYVIAKDGVLYIKLAKLIYSGDCEHLKGWYIYFFYPLLIALFYKITGNWVLAGEGVSALCGSLTVIPLYLLARRIFKNHNVAFLGSILYIVCPNLVRYSAEVLKDIPYVFFCITAIYWGYKGVKEEKLIFLILSGFFILLSGFLRVEGLVGFIIISLFIIAYCIKNAVPWVGKVLALWISLLGFVSVLIVLNFFFPQKSLFKMIVRPIQRTEAALFSLKNVTIKDIEKEIEKKGLSDRTKQLFHLAKKHRFVLYFSHIFYKTLKTFNFLFLFFLFGITKRQQIDYHFDEFLLVSVYLCFWVVFLLYLNLSNYLSTRHPFPLVTFSLVWGGVGFVEVRERIKGWLSQRAAFLYRARVLKHLTSLLLLLVCIPLLSMAWAPHRKDKLELKEIGFWLKEHGFSNNMILGQREFSRLAFYADCNFVPLRKGSYEELLKFARGRKATLLVVNARTIERFCPDFWKRLSPQDLKRIEISGVKTPKYATAVFLVKNSGK